MSSFKTSGKITLLEGDNGVDCSFEFTENTTPTSTSGFLPYGLSITDCDVQGYDQDGTAVALVDHVSVNGNIVTVTLSYPNTGPGTYSLVFSLTLSNGTTDIHARFDRVHAKSLPGDNT